MAVKQDSPLPIYDEVKSGEIAGSATAADLPDIPVAPGIVYLRGAHDNAGKVYLGKTGNVVTKADGTTDTTTGFSLAAGETIGPLVIPNLNVLARICDNAGDDLVYLILR